MCCGWVLVCCGWGLVCGWVGVRRRRGGWRAAASWGRACVRAAGGVGVVLAAGSRSRAIDRRRSLFEDANVTCSSLP